MRVVIEPVPPLLDGKTFEGTGTLEWGFSFRVFFHAHFEAFGRCSGGMSPWLVSPVGAQRPLMPFGGSCNYRGKFTEHLKKKKKKMMALLSIFPEISGSDLMALPPVLLS